MFGHYRLLGTFRQVYINTLCVSSMAVVGLVAAVRNSENRVELHIAPIFIIMNLAHLRIVVTVCEARSSGTAC